MFKSKKLLLVVSLMVAGVNATAAGSTQGDRSATPNAGSHDCIVSFVDSADVYEIKTKNGKELAFQKDKTGKILLAKLNGENFVPQYEENGSGKLTGLRSGRTGKLMSMEEATSAGNDEAKKSLRKLEKNALLAPCTNANMPSAPTERGDKNGGEITTSEMYWGLTPTPLWDDLGFYPEFMERDFWRAEHYAYFQDAYSNWAKDPVEQRRICIDRSASCTETCNKAGRYRGYACGAIALIFAELGPVAVIAGMACIAASDVENDHCQSFCPTIGGCLF